MGYGLVVLFTGLILRMVSTFLAVCGGGLTFKEKLFMVVAWLPKATAQAALGSVFLDVSHKYRATEFYQMGEQILTLAVVSILVTAPLGSLAIMTMGPCLLSKDTASSLKDSGQIIQNSHVGCFYNMYQLHLYLFFYF